MMKKLVLKNSQQDTISVQLRPYHEGDENGMIACIRDEYADTYFKRDFYDADHLRKEAKAGHITFLIAETNTGEIAGMMILKEFYPEENMCEIASQIFRKKYRGYGLAMPFFCYGMKMLLMRDYYAAFCLPVVFHNTTQRLLYRLGMYATGFVLNMLDMTGVVNSYGKDRNEKHSQGIMVRAIHKRDAGKLYIPKVHADFCRSIYDKLQVDYRLAQDTYKTTITDVPQSYIRYKQDGLQKSLEIYVDVIGFDLKERIQSIHSDYPLCKKQTANIFLNCNDINAPFAYRVLTEMGYFFAGLKPLCSEREYMVLHNPGEVRIFVDDYVLSDDFSFVAQYVKNCYEKMY